MEREHPMSKVVALRSMPLDGYVAPLSYPGRKPWSDPT